MSELAIAFATRRWSGWASCVQTWMNKASTGHLYYIVNDMDVLPAYQEAYIRVSREHPVSKSIIGYLHDDVICYEGDWDTRVLAQFDDPTVGVVGFGGALGHGTPNLYAVPYHLPNLARQHFMSNMRDAEKHGGRFKGERDVAIIDGFACFVRRSILDKTGGFPLDSPIGYFMWCESLCCEARRQGYRIRLVGLDCEHLGGRTSTVHQVSDDYEAEHAYFYEHNRDMMPFRVKE